MNKKFSTLVAGALLATTVGAVSAQDVANYSKSAAPSTLETVTKVTDGRVYQLSDGYKVLVMKKVSDGNLSGMLNKKNRTTKTVSLSSS